MGVTYEEMVSTNKSRVVNPLNFAPPEFQLTKMAHKIPVTSMEHLPDPDKDDSERD